MDRTSSLASLVLVVALLSTLLIGCGAEMDPGDSLESPTSEPIVLDVFATTAPLCYLVDLLAAEAAQCEVLSSDAQAYRPTAERIVEIGDADLIVVNGLGLEPWLEGASLPASRLVDASASVSPIELETVTHSHGPEGDHSHRETDPRAWLDPSSFADQADGVAAALVRALPEQEAEIEERRFALVTRLGAMVAQSRQRLSEASGGSDSDAPELATVTPHFRYLLRALGFEAEEFLPDQEDEELSGHDLDHLKGWLGKVAQPVVLVRALEKSPVERQVAAFDASELLIVELDDMSGSSDGSYDYPALFEHNVARLEAALSATSE